MVVVCLTEGCSEQGIGKPLGDVVLAPGEPVLCGACMKPCAQPSAE
jgi:hypothetical protein